MPEAGPVVLRGLDDGAVRGLVQTQFDESRYPSAPGWVSVDGRWLFVVCGHRGGSFDMAGFEVSASGRDVREAWRTRPSRSGAWLARGHHGGHFFATSELAHLERRDGRTGEVLEALAAPEGMTIHGGEVIGGELLAGLRPRLSVETAIARWGLSSVQAPRGPWGWPPVPARRGPDQIVAAEHSPCGITPAPQGEVATAEHGHIAARCARTFRLRASFHVAERWISRPPAFTPDGRVLVDLGDGVAVWPWRELMGAP